MSRSLKWLSHPSRLRRAALAALLLVSSGLSLALAEVTPDQAKAFWKDFDTQTMSGVGPEINKVYLPGVANPTPAQLARAKRTSQTEVFNGFQSYASLAIANETLDLHGLPVTPARRRAVTSFYSDLVSEGVTDRLSQLQLAIIQKHFPANGGGIDFAKFQRAVELFANGQLRVGGGTGAREMDQLHQWYVWKNFALVAIVNKISGNSWENIVHSLEKGLEIYRVVYPAPAGGYPLLDSDHRRFMAAKQLTGPQLTQLRNDIDSLTTTDVFEREMNALKLDTPMMPGGAGAAPGAMLNFDSVRGACVTGGFRVDLQARLTDSTGTPINGHLIRLEVSPVGIEVPQDVFGETIDMPGISNGEYSASLLVPFPELGYTFFAVDVNTLASDAFSSETASCGP